MERNPYTINFGKIPKQYINRDVLISEIVESLESEDIDEQAFKITGIRGTGKTVTLTAIEQELSREDNWIIVDIKPNSDITKELVASLYTQVSFVTKYIDANLNLSLFGIGVNIAKKSPVASIDLALKQLLEEIKRKKMRVLVVIDEVRRTDYLVDFILEFQILIRQELPLFLMVAGLYEDIETIENTDGLTFFLRASKYEMKPLNLDIIKENYKMVLGLSDDDARKLANMTMGYAFAYQAFGKYMWESKKKEISSLVLAEVDSALSEKVYDKIWSELRNKEKWYLSFIIKKEQMPVSELLEITQKKHNDWSEPRRRLIEKGIIDGKTRGNIKIILPRFSEYVREHTEL
ncbi:MAG: hypothetical protein IJV15_14210 [Lachnospiraceae bacterium]|nr:hypothetical protein [Lachnospiraceae bacterium]